MLDEGDGSVADGVCVCVCPCFGRGPGAGVEDPKP